MPPFGPWRHRASTGAASGVVVGCRCSRPSRWPRCLAARLRNRFGGWCGSAGADPNRRRTAYYPATSGKEQRSWQAAGAGVDFRGDGGYIIAPPSRRTIDGTLRRYEIADLAATSVGPVDAHGSVISSILDRPPATRNDGGAVAVDAERLAAWVASRGEGERNRGLFWAACPLAENGTPPADTLDALGPATQRRRA